LVSRYIQPNITVGIATQKTHVLWIAALVVVALTSVVGTAAYIRASTKERLMVSTTTSLFDTGLLDTIETAFESKHPIDLNFISVGTGLAITHAQRGDADLILVHSPTQEREFLTGGYGVCRKIIAYNYFAIVGPAEDPAEINGLTDTDQALSKIVESGRNQHAMWISRGDDSGTHTKEKQLWTHASYDPAAIRDEEWYQEASSGMGGTLKTANQFHAYTLADMGTYLAYYNQSIITLEPHVTQGEQLLNVYSAIATNKTLHASVSFDAAITFIKYLASTEGQQIVADYGTDQYGQPLFNPAVQLLKHDTDPATAEWIEDYAYFDGYECPPQYWNDHPELYP
jgi:tungstate transport system substrate-binding protein